MFGNRALIILVILLGVGFFAQRHLFPSHAEVIRGQLESLAEQLTKKPEENPIAVARKVGQALDHFVFPVEVMLSANGEVQRSFVARDKGRLQESLLGLKYGHSWVVVKFDEVNTTLRTGADPLEAETTAVARLEFESSTQGLVYDLYPLSLDWRMTDEGWRIFAAHVDRADEADK